MNGSGPSVVGGGVNTGASGSAAHNVCLLPEGIRLTVAHGTMISDAVQSAQIYLSLPCGGRGACGHCIVTVDGEAIKSCVTPVDRDMEIVVPSTIRLTGQKVLTDFRLYDPKENRLPRVERLKISLNEPSLDDAVSDASRLQFALAKRLEMSPEKIRIEPSCLVELPSLLRRNGFTVSVNLFYDEDSVRVLSLSEGPLYGLAVDIGTTTVAVALCNLDGGNVIETVGLPNPQGTYGADIISRIVYTEEDPDGTGILQALIVRTISAAVDTLIKQTGISSKDIYIMTVGANTVMSHFLLGLPTDWLRREPYVPAATEYPIVKASEFGFPMLPEAPVIVIPGVSSYVGGDITAGVIAAGLDRGELKMLVDVGTNGEIVLAGDGFMVACSSSAGPAFEGSGISCGSRAVAGAIDNVYFEKDHISYGVIGDIEPVSLCGSGLISMISALLQTGVIDRSGHFNADKGKTYHLTPEVFVTEDDILNLIRSKAAIFAGIRILARFVELEPNDISHIYISGGFGRSLNSGHAVDIGMLPLLPDGCFSYEGNSSLAGALRVLCDRTVNAAGIASAILNLELSVGNDFMDEFIQACFLPHTNLALFEAQ